MTSQHASSPEAGVSTQQPPAQAVHHEARNAENSAAYLLPKLYAMRDRNPNITLLDVGAGSGSITVALAGHLPDGHVTGVDVNANILPRARALAEAAGAVNIDFQEGHAKELPFADESFDMVICHQVLTHVPTPWEALREMLRVVKPGGIVAAREADYETECVWPDVPILTRFHKVVAETMISNGGTATAGRQLIYWALKAGVRRDQITPSFSPWTYIAPTERQTWAQGIAASLRAGPFRDRALQMGHASADELEEMATAWENWSGIEDASLAVLNGEILIRK